MSAADDPGVPNFTFRLTSDGPVIGPGLFTTFFIESTIGTGELENYTASSHTFATNVSEAAVSAVLHPTAPLIPEPGTMALVGVGAVCLVLKMRRQRTRD